MLGGSFMNRKLLVPASCLVLSFFSSEGFAFTLESVHSAENYEEALGAKNEEEINEALLEMLVCVGLATFVFITKSFLFKKYVVRKYIKVKLEEYGKIRAKFGGIIYDEKSSLVEHACEFFYDLIRCGNGMSDWKVFIDRLERLEKFVGGSVMDEVVRKERSLGFFEAIEVNKKLNEWDSEKR